MSYSVQSCKADLTGVLHGTTLDQIIGIDNLFNRTARQLLMDLDPQETKRILPFTNPIYNSVFDYAVPADLKGNKVIDIRPQVNRHPADILLQCYNQSFDSHKTYALQSDFTINFNNNIKTIRMNVPSLEQGLTLNEVDGLTGNGTWTVGGKASNLQEDNVNFASSSASLSCDLAAGANPSAGYYENSTMNVVDLTDHLNQSTIFAYVYLPTATNFISVNLRWGSDSANYWSKTVTVNQQGLAFQGGWNLIAFDWKTASQVLAPVVTAVDYLRLTLNYDGTAQTAVRMDNIVSRMGSIMEIEYYSKFLFMDGITGAFQETVTDDSNLINLDTESFNLFLNLLSYYAVQQQQGMDALKMDSQFFLNEYNKGLQRYKAMYKSEIQKPQSTYYKLPKNNYQRFINKRIYG